MKTIEVTQKDIDNGIKNVWKGRSRYCPVAMAMKRLLKNSVVVGYFECEIKKEGEWTCYDLPLTAQKFIAKFDNNHKVKPFSFELVKE